MLVFYWFSILGEFLATKYSLYMTINVNPNRIGTGSGGVRPSIQRRPQQSEREAQVPVPKRAHLNIIPAEESLATLIRSAVAALRQGATWDRGTILNLLV